MTLSHQHTTATADLESQAIACGILQELRDDRLVLAIPGTDYRLHLAPAVPASSITTPVGKRLRGTIEAEALRIFTAQGGGQFIEPIEGAPRIVAGRVLAVDAAQRRLLVNVATPMWLKLLPEQPIEQFAEGAMVNCYVESGARFTPVG